MTDTEQADHDAALARARALRDDLAKQRHDADITPQQARRLAQASIAAADEAEKMGTSCLLAGNAILVTSRASTKGRNVRQSPAATATAVTVLTARRSGAGSELVHSDRVHS